MAGGRPCRRHHGCVSTRIVTWNLQGRERPDLDEVADVLAGWQPDVVALQEVQRGQARALARRLGWEVAWRFKHWPVVVPPEGLALLSPTPLGEVRRAHLAARWQPWSWRRRIAVAATVDGPDGPVVLVNTHLGAGVGDDERVRQARRTIDLLDGRPGCVVGDLNTAPGSPVLRCYADAGLRDGWDEARPGEACPTNWRPGPRDVPPTQRLDYVLVADGLAVGRAEVPGAGDPGFARFGALSDHLPLLVELAPRSRRQIGA